MTVYFYAVSINSIYYFLILMYNNRMNNVWHISSLTFQASWWRDKAGNKILDQQDRWTDTQNKQCLQVTGVHRYWKIISM